MHLGSDVPCFACAGRSASCCGPGPTGASCPAPIPTGNQAAWLRAHTETFSDYREKIEWLVGEGDYVAWRSRGRGTMTGPMGDFPATGGAMELVILGMHRFEDGRVAETWTAWDNVAALSQLGLMPGN